MAIKVTENTKELLDITYDSVKETEVPFVFLCKPEPSCTEYALVGADGKLLIDQEIAEDTYYLYHECGRNLILYYSTRPEEAFVLATISNSVNGISIKKIFGSKVEFTVTPHKNVIGVSFPSSGISIMTYNGKKVTDKDYLNVITYKDGREKHKTEVILGINFMQIIGLTDREGWEHLRSVDIFDTKGKLLESDILTSEIEKRYGLSQSTLYSRNISGIEKRNKGNSKATTTITKGSISWMFHDTNNRRITTNG
jgi:hypothetical protein